MDVAAGREIHHRIGAPADRPGHLLDFLHDPRTDGRVADVRVHLDKEIPPDRHRLELDVIDVGGDDGAPQRNLLAHEFGRDEFWNVGAETLAVGQTLGRAGHRGLPREILAMGDVDHLLGDDPGASEFELGDHLARRAGAQRTPGGAKRRKALGRNIAIVLGANRAAGRLGVAARRDPRLAHRRQAAGEVDMGRDLGIGARRIVDPNGRLIRVAQRNFAERHANAWMSFRGRVDLAGARDRTGRHTLGRGEFRWRRNLVHSLVSALFENLRREDRSGITMGTTASVPSPA